MSATIKFRRGTSAQWVSLNPILSLGEPGLETDTGKIRIGDGVTEFVDLPAYLDEAGLSATIAQQVDEESPFGISVRALVEDMVLETLAANLPGALLASAKRTSNWTTTNHSGSGSGGGIASVLTTSLVGDGSLSVTFTGTGGKVWLKFRAPLVNHTASGTVVCYFVIDGVAAFGYGSALLASAQNRSLSAEYLMDTVEGEEYTVQVGVAALSAGTTGLTGAESSSEIVLAVTST